MHRLHLLFLVGVSLATTGCATLNSPISDIFSAGSDQAVAEPKNSDLTAEVPSFVVEMRGTNNESQEFKRPLTDETTYIQGVLVQSKALKHFGRVKIQLWRPRPDGDGYHKIEIPYDRKQRTVPPEYDYAIREGDRLVFMKDETTVLDDMLESLGRF